MTKNQIELVTSVERHWLWTAAETARASGREVEPGRAMRASIFN
jgi:hypothetical protein